MPATDTLTETIPVCPKCHAVMLRVDWDTSRPRARCAPCGKTYYYATSGEITLTAKSGRKP